MRCLIGIEFGLFNLLRNAVVEVETGHAQLLAPVCVDEFDGGAVLFRTLEVVPRDVVAEDGRNFSELSSLPPFGNALDELGVLVAGEAEADEPLSVQNKIASTIATYDDLIESNRRLQETARKRSRYGHRELP